MGAGVLCAMGRSRFVIISTTFISIIAIGVGLVLSELTLQILENKKAINLIDYVTLSEFSKVKINDNEESGLPIQIPHRYFGSIYPPNHTFFQNTLLTSNSDGFIDQEFPKERQPGLCIYGVFGGSAAMSWGIESDEKRFHSQLESILNTEYTSKRCRKYRVLNMGVGGFQHYAATAVYIYYQSLFDGVIFLVGNNECSDGGLFFYLDDPILNFGYDYGPLFMLGSAQKSELQNLQKKLGNIGEKAIAYPRLFRLHITRLIYKILIDRLSTRMTELNDEIRYVSSSLITLPRFTGDILDVRRRFRENYKADQYWNDDIPDIQYSIMRHVVPLTYTNAVITAAGLAAKRGQQFLSLIQPLGGVMERKKEWGNLKDRYPYFHKVCHDVLSEEAEKLYNLGIQIEDMNRIEYFKEASDDIFLDTLHLTEEGNRILAKTVFNLIRNSWGDND
jgi:hypothetical protein